MHVTRRLGLTKKRVYVRVSGVSPHINVVPFNHKLSTLERAVKERVFRVKSGDSFVPPPRPIVDFAKTLEKFGNSLVKFLPSTAPLTYQQFVDTYKGRKKELYQRALEDLRSGSSDILEDSSVGVFIKYEKVDRTSKTDPVPRVISPRGLKFNLRLGRFLKHLEHRIFDGIGELFGHTTIIKGFTYDKTAQILQEKWNMLNDPVAIGLDASRFDQHVSIDALKFEHSVYLDCYTGKHKQKLRKLLRYQLLNRCIGYAPDGKVSYQVKGTRMSGDMNTSLGNCILMCGMVWSYCTSIGVKPILANNGDDCVVFLERSDVSKFSLGLSQWFLDIGFNMVVEKPVDVFEQIEFCQTHPVFDGNKYTMCRNPKTAIAKDSVMLNSWQGERQFRGWLDAVGMGGLSIAGGLPIFQSFYKLFVRSGKKRKVDDRLLHNSWTYSGGNREEYPVDDRTRFSFWQAFNITPCEQVALENYYDNMSITCKLGGIVADAPIFQLFD